nr:MAG TPA: hypothetical protein [Bacteriophage sp.]
MYEHLTLQLQLLTFSNFDRRQMLLFVWIQFVNLS